MSYSTPSQPRYNPESEWIKLTAVNQAVRDMYQQEISKITFGIKEAKPDVQEVMQHAMNGLYATGIQLNHKVLPTAANDERFALSA